MNIWKADHFFPETIAHGFWGRQGGVSAGVYKSLNCSLQSQDKPENIIENRNRVLKTMGGNGLSTLKQVHSSICRTVTESCMQGNEEGDSLVTKMPGQVIACLTADCAPVLFYGQDDAQKPVIGAAHAGWGGALRGVLESTLSEMLRLGANASSIRAAIGPCIDQSSYEVGPEFQQPFQDEDASSCAFFKKDDRQKWFFDLNGYIVFRLNRSGVLNITQAKHNTYEREQDYFSYRRSTHRHEGDYGRQISAIMIRPY